MHEDNFAPANPSIVRGTAVSSIDGVVILASQQPAELAWMLAMLSSFVTQRTQSFCSVATAATMLNALGVPAPVDPVYAPHAYYTQANILGECALGLTSHTGAPLSAGFIATHGATLDEWAAYLSCWAHPMAARHASEWSVDVFRTEVAAALSDSPPRAVGLNFHRSGLGQPGGGHMSPVAAYSAATDSMLLLDVSRYKEEAAWFPVSELHSAMNTTDVAASVSRGWVRRPCDLRYLHALHLSLAAPAQVVVGREGAPPLPAAATVAERPSRARVTACIDALASDDSHGVLACMAQPPVAGRDACPPDGDGLARHVTEGAALALGCAGVVIGAGLVLFAQRHKLWGPRSRRARMLPEVRTTGEQSGVAMDRMNGV
jgi:hypothetical protein